MDNLSLTNVFDQLANTPSWRGGQLLNSGTAAFNQRISAGGLHHSVADLPALIIQPSTTQQVALALTLAWQQNLTVAAFGVCPAEAKGPFAWLDTHLLKGLELHGEEQTLRVGAGTLWGEVYSFLNGTGWAVVGDCDPTNGVANFVANGGFNPLLSRQWGLGCDNALAFTVVLHDGTVLKQVNQHTHTDFWHALRGGSQALGIVTEVTLSLYPASIDGEDQYLTYTRHYAGQDRVNTLYLLTAWQQWTAQLHEQEELRVGACLTRQPGGNIKVQMVWGGGTATQDVFERYLELWQQLTPAPSREALGVSTWHEITQAEKLSREMACPSRQRQWLGTTLHETLSPELMALIASEAQVTCSLHFVADDAARHNMRNARAAFPYRMAQYTVNLECCKPVEHEGAVPPTPMGSLFDKLLKDPYLVGAYPEKHPGHSPAWLRSYYSHLKPHLQQAAPAAQVGGRGVRAQKPIHRPSYSPRPV